MMAAGGASIVAGCFPRQGAHVMHGSKRGELRFVFYTDVHARTEWDTPEALQIAATAINHQQPDIVISGGDHITDGFQGSYDSVAHRWDIYMDMYHSIECDIYPILGNHDLVAAIPEDGSPPSDDPRAVYREKMGIKRTYYSFDAAGYHFIVLDSVRITYDDLKYHGMIGSEQMDWLKEDLSRTEVQTPVVLCSHIPLLTSFYMATEGAITPAPKNRVVVNNKEVIRLFSGHNLILVLQSHLHVKELIRWRDTTYLSGGAVCGKWWRGDWHGTNEGFCVVTLRDNRIEWEYVEYGWEERRPNDL
jgi:3',5'-cyclic AMP phosphodiesterase CpdA